jgi:hypothetical protein
MKKQQKDINLYSNIRMDKNAKFYPALKVLPLENIYNLCQE